MEGTASIEYSCVGSLMDRRNDSFHSDPWGDRHISQRIRGVSDLPSVTLVVPIRFGHESR